MRPCLTSVLALLLTATTPGSAWAWNKAGHMVSGAIAYSVLKQEGPQALARAVALLKQHPQYERRWEHQIHRPEIPESERDLYLFMLAARWADDIRNDPEFDPPGLHLDRTHYINLPFKPNGQPASVRTSQPDPNNILRGYEVNLAKLRDRGEGAGMRAVALCWVSHLIGDVHQPLHCASLFTTDYPAPRGDRGGTLFHIRGRPDGAAITLHQFWDDLIIGSQNYRQVHNRAIELRNRPEFARARLSELADAEFANWATRESFPLARDAAYRGGHLAGSFHANDAPPLPDDYAKAVQPLAERRIVLAGYRLAAVIRKSLD